MMHRDRAMPPRSAIGSERIPLLALERAGVRIIPTFAIAVDDILRNAHFPVLDEWIAGLLPRPRALRIDAETLIDSFRMPSSRVRHDCNKGPTDLATVLRQTALTL